MPGNAVIGALRVSLGLDSAQFDKGLKTAQGKLGGFGKIAGLGVAGIAGAAVAAAAAISVAVKGAINAADELSKTSQKVGVGVEALSRLKYAAELSDVSLEGLSTGLKKLGVNMAGVANGDSGKAADAFQRLGISVTDANGQLKSSDVVLSEVAGKFEGMQDGAQKTALAVALFGKSGADLIPLLNSGADGLKAMGDEAAQLGVVIDAQTGKAAEDFNDNLTRLGTIGRGITTQLAASLAPTLADVSGAFVATAKSSETLRGVGVALGLVLKGVASIAVGLVGALAMVGRGAATMAKVITLAFKGDFAGAVEAYKAGVVSNLKGIGDTAKTIQNIWTGAGRVALASAPKIGGEIAAPIAEGAKRAAKAAKQTEDAYERAKDAADDYVRSLKGQVDAVGAPSDEIQLREERYKAAKLMADGFGEQATAALGLIAVLASLRKEEQKVVDLSASFVSTPKELGDAIREMETDSRSVLERIQDGFYGISNAIDDVFYGAKNNDWVGAFSGLTRALQSIQTEFAKTGNAAGKIGAVAGVASSIGGMIGGKAGGALSAAASGAAAGASFGVPGAIIGGLIGGISGFLGASKAKKRAKKEAAARAKAEAEQKAADLAAAKRQLELEIMELQAPASAVLAERRKDELAAMDESLRGLQEQKWALEDAAAATALAAEKVAARTALERELLRLTDDAAAVEADRADALKALTEMDPGLAAVQRRIYDVIDAQNALARAEEVWAIREEQAAGLVDKSREQLADSYERERDALQKTRDDAQALADTLSDLGRELRTGSLAGLNPDQQAGSARSAFNRIAARIQAGDATALSELPDAVRAFRESSLATAGNPKAAAADLAAMRRAVTAGEALAKLQVTQADQQLAALNAQVEGLIEINKSVVSVRDAVNELNAVMAFAAAVQANSAAAIGELKTSLDGLTRSVNDNSLTSATSSFDAAAVGAAVDASVSANVPGAGGGASADLAGDIVDGLLPVLAELVFNTGETAAQLDDVINGPLALNTQAA